MRIVVKIGTSTLAHSGGRLNIRRVELLCKILSDLKNAGHEIVIVSSGAIAMGTGKLMLSSRPKDTPTKQAAAAVGQCELMYTYDKQFSTVIKRECVRKDGKILLERPDEADQSDIQRRTQTALEQVSLNQNFREVANFFRSIEYQHILPQAVRDPHGFSAIPVINDPYGRDFVRKIWMMPQSIRNTRLQHIEKVLQIAVPSLSGLKIDIDKNSGQPHLWAKFQHWCPNGAIQDESKLSDGTLRLIALFWMLLDKEGTLLIEEPELSLSEEIVRRLPTMFAQLVQGKQGRQILISTHSYALLDDPGIQPEEVLKLEPGKEGTAIRPLSDDAIKLMENGLTAAEAALPEIRQDKLEHLSLFSL